MTKFDDLLEAQGRSAAWVADRIGVSRTSVWRWRRGSERIPPARVAQLATLLTVAVREEDIQEAD